ncbi:MAG: branched-chain amino acid ABC transporter permease, partial [Solirubrobacterales bacterium]
MEAGAMTTGRDRSFGERLANTMSRVDQAPFVLKAAAGVLLLDLILVLTDRFPDSGGEWILLLAIYALSVAAMVPLERNPAALAGVVLANIVAVLILYHGLHDVSQRGLNGLSLGAIYALGAVGLTLVYGILKLVNFAHGDFLTFGAYMAYLVNVTWDLPLVLGIAFAIATTALLGIALEKIMWAPMRSRGAGMLQLLLMTIGLAFVIRYGIQF